MSSNYSTVGMQQNSRTDNMHHQELRLFASKIMLHQDRFGRQLKNIYEKMASG
jgi:hypothetical protein